MGSELVPYLRERLGAKNVIASDVRVGSNGTSESDGPFVYCDVRDRQSLARVVLENRVDCIVHLATVLSAIGERNPDLALAVNNEGTLNCLNVAPDNNLQIFCPSTIAVFGPTTPRDETPDITIMEPSTVYGITKVHLEHLGNYYQKRYGLDFRSLRYPGIVSSAAMPGGGTTDYAVEIYYAALEGRKYISFIAQDQRMPFLYMPDCLRATYEMIMAPREKLSRNVYNVTSMTFSPRTLGEAIAKQVPGFEMDCTPDFRQKIATSWPRCLDDSNARRDWGWTPEFDIDSMTTDMLQALESKMIQGQKSEAAGGK